LAKNLPPSTSGIAEWQAWLASVGLSEVLHESAHLWMVRHDIFAGERVPWWAFQGEMRTLFGGQFQIGLRQFQQIRNAFAEDAAAAAVTLDAIDAELAAAEPAPEAAPAFAALLVERQRLMDAGVRDVRTAAFGRFDPLSLSLRARVAGCERATEVELSFDENAPACCRCDCVSPRAACAARLAVVQAGLKLLARRQAGQSEELHAALGVPVWQRTLQSLDLALGNVPEATVTLGWAIDPERERLEPVRVEATGKKQRITLWPLDGVGHMLEYSRSGRDAAVLDLWSGRNRSVNFAAVLVALVDHPTVFRWPEKAAVRVVRRDLQFDIREEASDLAGARIVVSLGEGVPVDTAMAGRGGTYLQDEVLWWDSQHGVEFTRISPQLRSVLTMLARFGGRVPAEAVPGLLERLPRLARVAPVRTDNLAGLEELPPAVLPVVVVEALPAGALAVSVRVRPVDGGPVFVAGEGPVQVIAATADGVRSTRRTFARELEAVAGLGELLDAPDVLDIPDWVVEDPQRSLALVERLSAASDRLTVQWRQKPLRIGREVAADKLKINVNSSGRWFQVAGVAHVDGTTVPLGALLEAARLGRSFFQVAEGHWARIEDSLRRQLVALGRNANRQAAQPSAAAGETEISGVNAGLLAELELRGAEVRGDQAWKERLLRMEEARALQPELPRGLRAELRPYQVEGYVWMMRLAHWAGGAILADDMGLGKTVQALTVLLARAEQGPALVIAPTSLAFNWLREAAVFAPSLRVRLHRGAGRERALADVGPGDVVVTSYDTAVLDREGWKIRFSTVVFDEAHALKNAGTQRAQAAVHIEADCRIALTGTPIENRIGELWSLFRVILPGVFGSAEHFRERWVNPIERDRDPDARQGLSRLIQPFVLRRTKSEVAKDLPPRTEVRIDVDLGTAARQRYDEMRSAMARVLQGLDDATRPEQHRFYVLTALTRLRQIACHPGLIDPTWTGGSPKLDALVNLVRELKEGGRRVLVFSQFTEHLRLAADALSDNDLSFRYLDGTTPPKQRDDEVSAFMAGEGDAFLLSVKAGGVGLNLTAASDVVILDPWWNPAVEDQAADRAHRIGQQRAVTIYRLVARNTVEEQMLDLHVEKRELVSAVLSGAEGGGALSVEDMIALLQS
jgi:superfamily II DNA or RNA helicase